MSIPSITPFIWPDEKDLTITLERKIKIEALINRKFPEIQSSLAPEYAAALQGGDDKNFWYDAKDKGILCTEEILGEGSDSKVRKGYSPVTGKFYAIKEFKRNQKEHIRWVYTTLNDIPYVVHCHSWTEDNFAIEEMANSTLRGQLGKSPLDSTVSKVEAISQIITGLHGIHSKPYTNTLYQGRSGYLSHRDLKPHNIFCLKKGQENTFLIGDYSRMVLLDESGTYAYMSPEGANLIRHNRDNRVLFNLENGAQLDLWALGILISSILKNHHIPFKWFEPIYKDNNQKSLELLSQLNQPTIDLEIDQTIYTIEKNLSLFEQEKRALIKAWKMVKKYLLKHNSTLRRDTAYLLKKIEKIKTLLNEPTKVATTFNWPCQNPFGLTEESRKKIEENRSVVNTREVIHATFQKYYQPDTGSYLIGKSFSKVDFNEVLDTYRLVEGKEHLVQNVGIWMGTKMVFEKLYWGNDLGKVYKQIREPKAILDVIYQIALGLKSLHSITIEKSFTVQDKKQTVRFQMSHKALSPTNIFVTPSRGGGFQCDIGGYSDASKFILCGAKGYESPKFAECWLNVNNVEFSTLWGQRHDLFAFGLTCVTLLKGETYADGIPPLAYLEKTQFKTQRERYPALTQLTQVELDGQLDRAMEGTTDKTLIAIWRMVKENLLRVNFDEMGDISGILTRIDSIREQDLSEAMDQLKLIDVSFKWPHDSRKNIPEIETEIKKVMASAGDEMRIQSVKQYELIYNRNKAFLKTGELLNHDNMSVAYKCYSPITGKFYAFHSYISDKYKLIQGTLNLLDNPKNCVPSICTVGRGMITPIYPSTLDDDLKEHKFQSTKIKLDAMLQIANGISHLHAKIYTNDWFDNQRGPMSHRNLHPKAIFSNQNEYDIACERVGLLTEKGTYKSPEEAALPEDIDTKSYVAFASEKGPGIDIWSLGHIFRLILRNSDEPLASMSQSEIDQEIAREITQIDPRLSLSERAALDIAWKLVNQMLCVDPEKRCNIQEVLTQLRSIKSQASKACVIH